MPSKSLTKEIKSLGKDWREEPKNKQNEYEQFAQHDHSLPYGKEMWLGVHGILYSVNLPPHILYEH